MIDIFLLTDLNALSSIKEQIKNQVKENITWQHRMELYRKVQMINERILELQLIS